jgi:hypothetical protein
VVYRSSHFPWEDRYYMREFTNRDPVFSKNPYDVPEVDQLLTEDPQQPPVLTPVAPPSHALRRDCFALLPRELCAAIAMLLPTADVLAARLASQAFWPVFDSQQFWASRFRPPAAVRSWLFETRHGSPSDWRWLYRQTTRDIHLSGGLRNRRRIWGLAEQVLELLALAWNNLPPAMPAIWCLSSGVADERFEAAGLLWNPTQPDDHNFPNGCRLLRTQRVAIPDALSRLSVSTAAFGDGEYIVGMSLATAFGTGSAWDTPRTRSI